MKLLSIILFLTTCVTLFQCASQKKTEYDIPSHVSEQNKQLLIERGEKGKVLYKIHCSHCHGIFTNGKDSIPNFTDKQIDDYKTTALIGLDPKNHAVAAKLSPEQVDYIITFLRLRKVKK